MIMKKRVCILLLTSAFFVCGCENTEELQNAENAEKEQMRDSFDRMDREFSVIISNVLSKEWIEKESNEIYVFSADGDGSVSGADFSYYCGFDEKNDIILKIVMDDTAKEAYYYVSTDETGYGLYLDGPGTENDLYLMQNNIELFDLSDEQTQKILGEWSDQNDHRYIFKKDGTMLVKGTERDSEGTFRIARYKETGEVYLMLVTGSNSMEFQYEFVNEDTLELCRPGTDTVHTWEKVK